MKHLYYAAGAVVIYWRMLPMSQVQGALFLDPRLLGWIYIPIVFIIWFVLSFVLGKKDEKKPLPAKTD